MARVAVHEVRPIMDDCVLDKAVIEAYITGANLLVTKILGDDTTIGSDLLKEIEKWFTAHMIASTTHRSTKKEKLGDASVEYTGQFRENLSSTPYGQMVIQLDSTGKMGSVGKRNVNIHAVKSFD